MLSIEPFLAVCRDPAVRNEMSNKSDSGHVHTASMFSPLLDAFYEITGKGDVKAAVTATTQAQLKAIQAAPADESANRDEDTVSIFNIEFNTSSEDKVGQSGHKMPKLQPYENMQQVMAELKLLNELTEKLGYRPKMKPGQKLTPDIAKEMLELHEKQKAEMLARIKSPTPNPGKKG
jgi:hypothetical protein